MTLPITHCDRCGYPVARHHQPGQPWRWTGCPLPPDRPVPRATCAFQGCYAEQNDPLLGLCPDHKKQARQLQSPGKGGHPARPDRFMADPQ